MNEKVVDVVFDHGGVLTGPVVDAITAWYSADAGLYDAIVRPADAPPMWVPITASPHATWKNSWTRPHLVLQSGFVIICR
jgi:hypothetical protein